MAGTLFAFTNVPIRYSRSKITHVVPTAHEDIAEEMRHLISTASTTRGIFRLELHGGLDSCKDMGSAHSRLDDVLHGHRLDVFNTKHSR
ncbi:unnamed protein product [Chondrus crispus]|uniref:Uncharacterized protein n=1 Tax=Chondrus crispus TaxID=2769 RepID=R7QUK2_CHOCR|nr:unnamed protein product [Chondrus crispus]CDF41000.1 unnamed protein product [Chondrus crispus]|eukprot:XP_005711294.1 unnamed protein product [Chondrus crispus]